MMYNGYASKIKYSSAMRQVPAQQSLYHWSTLTCLSISKNFTPTIYYLHQSGDQNAAGTLLLLLGSVMSPHAYTIQ